MMSGYELSRNQRTIHSDYRRSDDRVTLDSDLVTLDGCCRSKTEFLVTKSDPDLGHGRTDGRTVGTHTHRFLEALWTIGPAGNKKTRLYSTRLLLELHEIRGGSSSSINPLQTTDCIFFVRTTTVPVVVYSLRTEMLGKSNFEKCVHEPVRIFDPFQAFHNCSAQPWKLKILAADIFKTLWIDVLFFEIPWACIFALGMALFEWDRIL